MLSTNVLCMKKRKKRSYYVSNVSDFVGKHKGNKGMKGNSKSSSTNSGGVTMMQITEDTPPDMLAGAMDLTIHLPDGKASKMSVERSTPMMDVLVQITNSNQLQISGYTLQPLAINSTPGFGEKILPFMPNTPIGTLDTQDIRVVAKNRGTTTLQRTTTTTQPFESTFRLKVHLPRNQLWVERVSMNAYLRDIMRKLCDEKNLDVGKYEFRHPGNLDQVLDLKLRLADYQITEIYAVSKGSKRLTQVFSSSDSIMAFRKDDERKQKSNSGGGLFNFLKRGGKISSGSGSLSSDNRSISPTHSDDSRSLSPPLSNAPVKLSTVEKPKPPLRKRRPAPKPPAAMEDAAPKEQEDQDHMKKKDGLTICHSRNSSDSSGYHEASILSDNANTSLPRKRPPSNNNNNNADSAVSMSSTSNLHAMKHQSKSTSSLAFPSRKKKAPPPPSVIKSASSVAHLENASPVVASPTEASDVVRDEVTDKNRTPCVKVNEEKVEEESKTTNLPPETPANDTVTEQSSNKETDLGDFNTNNSSSDKEIICNNEEIVVKEEKKEQVIAEEELQRKVENTEKENTVNVSAITSLDKVITKGDEHDGVAYLQCDQQSVEMIDNTEWEYQLPSPPTAFRDSSPQPTSVSTESETVSDIHPSTDSILTSPELFEKLNVIKESQLEIQSTNSVESEEDKFISKLSLENLEKRKKLVYNRELATSLKYKDDHDAEDITSKRFNVLNELEDVLANPTRNESNKNWNNIARSENFTAQNERKLPNFKITTYDVPKKKINIFEDDSIRSNVNAPPAEEENVVLRRPQQEFNKHRCMTLNRELLHRSESFSTWTPTAPVKRSKSQAFVKPMVQKREGIWAAADCNTSSNEEKSRSTLDLTGLQSLEVMKAIRTTLTTTPSTSITTITHNTDEIKKQPKQIHVYETPSISLTSWQERKSSIEKITTVNNNNVTIKINGNETSAPTPPPQQPANVVIKVNSIKEDSTKRFINRTTAMGYRKPLGNINKVERPHSIAIDQCDASRVPVVRSVELKKTFKQNNNASPFSHLGTSITQIRPEAVRDDRAEDKNQLFEKVILRNVSVNRERPKSVSTIQNADTRGQLLDAIRNFGGKKGLKTVRT